MTAEIAKQIIDQMPHSEVERLYTLMGVQPQRVNVVQESVNLLYSLKTHDICFTPEECAKYLGKHINTVRAAIKKGEIKAFPVGATYSIPKIQFIEKIIEYVQNNA
ncbi:helix-turn-helix domain-containing protein [Capnocytophaga canimorsus]|uniref:helix-turn-helix domain-containing protein n=1 Tax=Capnocytophaga canimorsus TaxID=28188 RepID=UPI0037D615B0